MKHHLLELLNGIPFFLVIDGKLHLNYSRIVEAVIIAIVCGFMAAQFTVSELKIKLAFMQGQNERIERQLSETCLLLQKLGNEVTRIDTLQKERIARERAAGIH